MARIEGEATRLWALDGATFTLDSGILVVHAEGEVTIPVPTFLIEHPKGLVLFDTGIVPEAADDPRAVYGDQADHIQIAFTQEQRVDRQIEAAGFRVDQVTHVLVSHSHFDHTGGLHLFPNAQFYIGAGDLQYAFWPMPAASAYFRPPDIEATRAFAWNQILGDFDLFGDGSIIFLDMPGHTPGNRSLQVRLPHRTVLLTGDTVHLRSALEEEVPMGSDYNTLQAVQSVRRLRQLQSSLDAQVWIAHDPEDWQMFAGPTCID